MTVGVEDFPRKMVTAATTTTTMGERVTRHRVVVVTKGGVERGVVERKGVDRKGVESGVEKNGV